MPSHFATTLRIWARISTRLECLLEWLMSMADGPWATSNLKQGPPVHQVGGTPGALG